MSTVAKEKLGCLEKVTPEFVMMDFSRGKVTFTMTGVARVAEEIPADQRESWIISYRRPLAP
uniref:Uncharacterized protein n=1 Tax=Candidatus Kentrum sp. SD TaxID=2126332 RepID=A0A450YF49_9GAMM|nr:MAG: hypothetical protein BECKSD772F_GA0070984_105216 [Candidatus Kentron sp. SD]VFK45234.1 MAG: hypothetical protein BECKSD772E_GA0070983_105016 [Candidatus Kentron sp. SD]